MDHHGAHGARPPWAELPPDALSEVAFHLRDATDLVRFHAVCRPWRDAPPPPRAPRLLPWLIAPPPHMFTNGLHIRSPFSGKSLNLPHAQDLRFRNLECSDAANGRVLAVGVFSHDLKAALVNPLIVTGDDDATYLLLPPLPGHRPRRDLEGHRVIMYHLLVAIMKDKATAICAEAGPENLFPDVRERRVAALCASGILRGGARAAVNLPPWRHFIERYVLEFQGEMLCVEVDVRTPWAHPPPHKLVSVQAMEVGDVYGKPRWVERDQRNDADNHVCFFLGWESSFAVDAREFACAEVTGGCAYFVGRNQEWPLAEPLYAVYRYSFKDNMATVVSELSASFATCSLWFIPRPRLQPSVLLAQCAQ